MVHTNLLRALMFAVGAAILIFNQNHSLATGTFVLEIVSAGLALGGVVLMIIPDIKVAPKILALPTATAFLVAYLLVYLNDFQDNTSAGNTMFFRFLIPVLIAGIAATEAGLSINADKDDRLELRISAAIGLVTLLIFLAIPLDTINGLGILSAYFAISAVQRGIWIATPRRR